jgi:hypothetical protein
VQRLLSFTAAAVPALREAAFPVSAAPALREAASPAVFDIPAAPAVHAHSAADAAPTEGGSR